MAKVMKTAWDESADIAHDASYPDSILSDGYLRNVNADVDEMNDDLDRGLDDEDDILESDDEECDEECDCE